MICCIIFTSFWCNIPTLRIWVHYEHQNVIILMSLITAIVNVSKISYWCLHSTVIKNITTTSLWCYIPKLLGKCLHFRSNLIKFLSPSTFYFSRPFPLSVFQLVSVTEIRIPLTTIKIPITKIRIPIIEIILPLTEIRISLTGIRILLTEIRIPVNEVEIPQTEFQFSPVVIEFPIANFSYWNWNFSKWN